MQELANAIAERYYERKLSIDTRGGVPVPQLDRSLPDSLDYVPITYRALMSCFRKVHLHPGKSEFLDYGAGKGRAVVFAATLPFARVWGVELSPSLAAQARENIKSASPLRCRAVEILEMNAADFEVPDAVDVIYMFKPFLGATLVATIDQIRASYVRSPRAIHIVVFNDEPFQDSVEGQDWLRKIHTSTLDAWSRAPIAFGIYATEPRPPASHNDAWHGVQED